MHVQSWCFVFLNLLAFFDVLVAVALMDLKVPVMHAYLVESLVGIKSKFFVQC